MRTHRAILRADLGIRTHALALVLASVGMLPAQAQAQSAARSAMRAPTSAEVAARLRMAGLEPADPALGAKLRALAARVGPSFANAQTTRSAATRVLRAGAAGLSATAGSGGSQPAPAPSPAHSSARIPFARASIEQVFDGNAMMITPKPVLSPTSGPQQDGRCYFLVKTSKPPSPNFGQTADQVAVNLDAGCTPPIAFPKFHTSVIKGQAARNFRLPEPPDNFGGAYWFFVSTALDNLPVPQDRPAKVTLLVDGVLTAPFTVTLQPSQGTATITLTVSSAPALAGIGSLAPWGSTNFSAGSAKLANPGAARVGAGNWQVQTEGDDLLGLGVQLGPGWKVTATTVKSAVSACAPQDLTPDNSWRGAKITAAPMGPDLRTAVHWHYSGVDSLDYTVEWKLSGPIAQRPLLTMAKINVCEN